MIEYLEIIEKLKTRRIADNVDLLISLIKDINLNYSISEKINAILKDWDTYTDPRNIKLFKESEIEIVLKDKVEDLIKELAYEMNDIKENEKHEIYKIKKFAKLYISNIRKPEYTNSIERASRNINNIFTFPLVILSFIVSIYYFSLVKAYFIIWFYVLFILFVIYRLIYSKIKKIDIPIAQILISELTVKIEFSDKTTLDFDIHQVNITKKIIENTLELILMVGKKKFCITTKDNYWSEDVVSELYRDLVYLKSYDSISE